MTLEKHSWTLLTLLRFLSTKLLTAIFSPSFFLISTNKSEPGTLALSILSPKILSVILSSQTKT